MDGLVDLDRYPLDHPGSDAWAALVARASAELDAAGMVDLPGFLVPSALAATLAQVRPLLPRAHLHAREHNIYFRRDVPGLPPDHPALRRVVTTNRTLCADDLAGNPLLALYRDPRLAAFLAAATGKPALFPMDDPLAAANVMAYEAGEGLNWHFDRSEFTTTILLQSPEGGGRFQHRAGLRSDDDPNYEGVARLLDGRDPEMRAADLTPGSLNVFRGRHTAHRVTPTEGPLPRIVAVLSYFDRPGVALAPEERVGFYGRAGRRTSDAAAGA